MAMGGASVGVGGDVFAIASNPAGLSSSDERFLVGGTQNRVVNREAELIDQIDLSRPYEYMLFAGVYNFKKFSLGLAYTAPYAQNLELDFQSTETLIEAYQMALSFKVTDKFFIGLLGEMSQAKLAYKDTGASIDLKEEVQQFNWIAGLFLQGKKISIGLSYRPSLHYDFDESENGALGFDFFRDMKRPAQLNLGFSYRPKEKLLLAFDIDFVEKLDDTVLIGSSLYSGEIPIVEESRVVYHGGLEYQLLKKSSTEVLCRVGAYQEPTRLYGGRSRFHYTLGLEVRLGPAILSVSFDQAESFDNTAQGFSISVGNL